MPEIHAKLSASGAKKWLNCPLSISMESEFPNEASQYAAEGTIAHALGELKIRFENNELTKRAFNSMYMELAKSEFFNDEMLEYTDSYKDFVIERFNEAKKKTPDAILMLEQKLDFSEYVPEGFGTGDVIIIADGNMEIIDLKYGKGVLVSAENNPQLRLYALGAISEYDYMYDITSVTMTIYQPRIDNISSENISVEELLKWGEDVVKPKAKLAFEGRGEYGSVDLVKSGVYAYANAPDFKILLFAYAFDDEDVKIVDLACGEELPYRVRSALISNNVIKTAYNANFEMTCIKSYFNINLHVHQWRCSAVAAAELGLPQTLAGVAKVLGLDEQKDTRGKALIKYFCMPCKPTKANGGRTINLPEHDTEKWNAFKEYCIQDVEVERAIKKKISKFPITESEQKLWEYDQRINDRGVRVDLEFANNAIRYNEIFKNDCLERAIKLTGLENPNSVAQLKKWITEQTGTELKTLNKETLKELLSETDNEKVKEILRLRAVMSKTSVSKYEAMTRSVCNDNRIRGLLQFYGANRTGRWAGRIVQVQNLPQNHLNDLELANQLVKDGDYELFEMLFGNVPQVLSELIRTAFIPSEGRRFIVSDFSAIEARVIAYFVEKM